MGMSLFTAEASLYKPSRHYRYAGLFERAGDIIPQQVNCDDVPRSMR